MVFFWYVLYFFSGVLSVIAFAIHGQQAEAEGGEGA